MTRSTLLLSALVASTLALAGTVSPALAGQGDVDDCEVTWSGEKSGSVPPASRRGKFISHFDGNGVPQSLITDHSATSTVDCDPSDDID